MGFSLENLFRELEYIMGHQDNIKDPEKVLAEIKRELEWQKKYAEECGQLNK